MTITSGETKYFFTCGEKIFHRDSDALLYASASQDEVKFHLDFDIFKKENRNLWLIEPENDISFYWDKYAKILQSKYDHLYIPYSGGTDSNTILRVFLKNEIHGVTLVNLTDKSGANKILSDTKFPVKTISEKYRNVFQYFNYKTIAFEENYLIPEYDPRIWETTLDIFPTTWNIDVPITSGNALLKWSKYLYADDKSLITMKDNDCVIYGYEKPKIRFKDGWWGWQTHNEFQFIDNRTPFVNQKNTSHFFISNEVPEIQIKMAWIMIRLIKNLLTQYGFPITTSSVDQIQEDKNFFYTKIVKGLGLNAVTPLLNTKLLWRPGGGAIRDISPEITYGKYYKDFLEITENYTTKTLNKIDPKYLSGVNFKKIYSDFIPICENKSI